VLGATALAAAGLGVGALVVVLRHAAG